MHELKPRIVNEGDLSRRIKSVAVFAQAVPGGLRVLADGALVVVPGDRHDVIMAACLAAVNGTRLAGLVLTPGSSQTRAYGSWRTARAQPTCRYCSFMTTATRPPRGVDHLNPGLPVDDSERLRAVTGAIADALDPSWLDSLSSSSRPRRLSPAAFRYQLRELAHAANACIVLPEGTSPERCRQQARARTEGSHAACYWGDQTTWPARHAAWEYGCPTASTSSTLKPSPSAMWPPSWSSGATAAGANRSRGIA